MREPHASSPGAAGVTPASPPVGPNDPGQDATEAAAFDAQLAHVWMVRAFLKHAEETEEDDDLREVSRALYDYMLALGESHDAKDWPKYFRIASKKFGKLRKAAELFTACQPEISDHTNFKMAVISLNTAVARLEALLAIRSGRRSPATPSGGQVV